jgi:hypothetical protein
MSLKKKAKTPEPWIPPFTQRETPAGRTGQRVLALVSPSHPHFLEQPMAKRLDVDLKVTRLLLEIGVMAVWIKRVEDGEAIIQQVKAFRADVPQPSTALAAGLIYQQRTQDAIEELESALKRFPNHQIGKSLLAIAYADAGRRGWQELCKQVIDYLRRPGSTPQVPAATHMFA